MTLVAKSSGEFELAPAGTYLARCCMLIDLGTQYSEFYKKSSMKVLIGWEIDELKSDGTPFVVFRRFTNSLSENAHLRSQLESWRGRKFTAKEIEGFDLTRLMGVGCMLTIVHDERDGKHFANVQTIAKMPKGTKLFDAVTEPIEFTLDNPNWEAFNLLSEKLQETINNSAEMKARNRRLAGDDSANGQDVDDAPGSGAGLEEEYVDDIPFNWAFVATLLSLGGSLVA